MKTLAAALCLMAAPVLAQDWSTVEFMARGLDKDDPVKRYRAAVAACLAGQGDPARTAELFTEGGWDVVEEAEMGLIEMSSPDENFYALAASDGSFCAAYSEVQGTDVALGNVQIISGAAGLALESFDMPEGCLAFGLAPDVQVEITSSGNDPVCQSETSSSVRFIFAPAG